MPLTAGPSPAAWNRLAHDAGNLFATHTWASCWWDFYGDGAQADVLCDDLADPTVVLPLVVTGRVLRQARFIGHGPADQLGPVCAPEHRPRAQALLREALEGGRVRADVVLLQDMPLDEPWWQPLGGRQVSSEVSPVVDLAEHDDWESFLASRSRNLRAQMRRKTAKLEDAHDVTYRLATAATIEADLATLFDLHARRWEGESPLLDERQGGFTAAFARAALAQGWLRLWFLEIAGRPVATALVFEFAGASYCYQLGRDPDHDHESVGFVLMVRIIRAALESGLREFRFLRGDEGYKGRFATREPMIESIAHARTARGRVAVRAALVRRHHREVAAQERAAVSEPAAAR